MKIKILTVFPEMFDSVLSASILGRAREQGLLEVTPVDIRPFSDRKHKNTDDYPFGGGIWGPAGGSSPRSWPGSSPGRRS